MTDKKWLTRYVRLVALAGAAVIGHSLVQLLSAPHSWEWLLFAGLALATGNSSHSHE